MYVIMQIKGETGKVLQAAKTEDKQAAAELASELSDRTVENARQLVDILARDIGKYGFGCTDIVPRVGVRVYGIGADNDIDWSKETLDDGLKLAEIPDIKDIPRVKNEAVAEKPRPCPMCGCEDISPKALNVYDDGHDGRFGVKWQIRCPECGCSIPAIVARYKIDADGKLMCIEGDGRAELIHKWNGKRGSQQ